MKTQSYFYILLCLLCAIANPIRAQELTAQNLYNNTFTKLSNSANALVITIIDPLTLQLDNGDIIHLSGIDAPYMQSDINASDSKLILAAKEILTHMLVGQQINIYTAKDSKGTVLKNRMGHIQAHIERDHDRLWVQGALISLGLARTRTFKSTPHMASNLYDIEDTARAQKIGLWAFDRFDVKPAAPQNIPLYSAQIIEGTVQGTAKNKGRLFINFGKDWRTDTTLIIDKSDQKAFYKAGIDPLNWGGKRLQARGWVDEYNGPVINITHPEQVRILSTEK